MKITFLDLDDIKNPLLAGGQAKATYEVGRLFAKKGHKVVSLCSKYPGYKDRTQDGIEYKHIGIGTNNMQLNNAVYILTLPFVVPFLKSDIIIECFTAPITTLFSPLYTKVPVVALPTVFAPEEFAKKYHLPFDKIAALGYGLYKYFMPYIESDEIKFRKYNKHAISVRIPQGVGEEYFKIKHKKPRHILYLGRLDMYQKGIDLLIKAYATVADKIKYPLIIAGGGPDATKIKELIKKLKLEDKVIMYGSAYGEAKMKLLAESLFVAFPSRYDNLPLFSVEAIAAGMPLVTFSIPEFNWLSPSYSFQAKPFKTHEYGQMLLLASKSAKLSGMRQAARRQARAFTWPKVSSMMLDFFELVLKKENKK